MRMLGPTLMIGLALLAGCSGSSDSATPEASTGSSKTDACDEVRAGIESFNASDYAMTVDHFRKAMPLAVDQAKRDDSSKAADLVEAVTYYAELDPDQYAEAAQSSKDFAKYKAITLGQCVPVQQPGGSDEPPQVVT